MYRKTSIKVLTTIFSVLLAVVVLVGIIDSRKSGRTFRSELVNVNKGDVTAIEVFPRAANGERILLVKEDSLWKVEANGKKFPADQVLAGSMVDELNGLKPERVAATGKSRWNQYEVSDSLATKVRLLKGKEVLTELFLGKFTYSREGKMATYLRLASDNRVYGVDGMTGMTFNRNVNAFRDKTVIRSAVSDWVRLTFTCPADSSFTLQKVNDKWMIDNSPVDLASVASYLSSVANLTETGFAETLPSGVPTHRLLIEGNNQMQPIQISGYPGGENSIVIESSQNRGNYFNSPELVKKVFISKGSLLKK